MDNRRTTRGTSPGQLTTGQPTRTSQNSSTGSQGQPGGSAPQGTPPRRRISWLQWLIYIVIINLLFYLPLLFGSLGGQQPTISLSYTSFLQQVQQGNVKDVTLTGFSVSGDFKTPLNQTSSGTTTSYPRFSSYVPETGDPTLLSTLEQNNIQVTGQPTQTPWWQTALTILLNALPFLLLIYLG
jgi:cell division protease FtsH